MDNVIGLKNFQFQDYKRGWKHLRKDLESSQVTEHERTAFIFHYVGAFIRLARVKWGHSLEEAAHLFDVEADVLSSYEQGHLQIDKTLLVRICEKYSVQREYQEFDHYLRGAALHPEQKKALSDARSVLEWNGFFDRRDW